MPDYRCPKHDRIFESYTDQRKPGALVTGNLPAHPTDGHPDCPKCQEEANGAPARTLSGLRVSNRAA